MQALIRASEINRDILSKFIGEIVTKCALLSNFSMDAIKINIIVQELAKDIQTRFRLLELPEIEKAFNEGVRGNYGEYMGLSVVTFNKWLKSYIDSGEHQEYVASKVKELKHLLPEITKPTDEEIDRMICEGLVDCFETYKRTGFAIDYGSVRVNYLLRKKILDPTEEERSEFKIQAREILIADASAKKESTNRIERKDAKREFEELINSGDENSKIQSLAKNLCLKEFFEELIINNKNINDVLH